MLAYLDIKGAKMLKSGAKIIPEMVNRKTVFSMKFKGKSVKEEQMFRRIKTMSPTNYVRHVGIKNRKVLKPMEYIEQLEFGDKAILPSPEQVKNGF